ncbi:unnamed protein product [Rhizophagus irregularis]|nr:unnamed protein product [Rhizophagus irregularis]
MNISAQNGYPNAALLLGCYYLNGNGCVANLEFAFKYFKIAAEKNVAGAQYVLAVAYEEGQGTGKNFKKAIYWYKIAARNGYQDAKDTLLEYLLDDKISLKT